MLNNNSNNNNTKVISFRCTEILKPIQKNVNNNLTFKRVE